MKETSFKQALELVGDLKFGKACAIQMNFFMIIHFMILLQKTYPCCQFSYHFGQGAFPDDLLVSVKWIGFEPEMKSAGHEKSSLSKDESLDVANCQSEVSTSPFLNGEKNA